MKKLLLILSIFFMGVSCIAQDYDSIYENLKEADFEYVFGIDPFQAEDYVKYNASPYPLLRLGVDYKFKDTVIERGYYLLTPREKNGQDYVLFKQEGRVKYIIPVYKKELVDVDFYQKHVPSIKKGPWSRFCDNMSKTVGKISKQSKRSELPKAYIEADEIGNRYWQLFLYYDTQKYYMLFEKE